MLHWTFGNETCFHLSVAETLTKKSDVDLLLDLSIKSLNESLDIYLERRSRKKMSIIANVIQKKGTFYIKQHNFELALQCFNESLKIKKSFLDSNNLEIVELIRGMF